MKAKDALHIRQQSHTHLQITVNNEGLDLVRQATYPFAIRYIKSISISGSCER